MRVRAHMHFNNYLNILNTYITRYLFIAESNEDTR